MEIFSLNPGINSGQNANNLAMDNQAWHQRFLLQSLWTKQLRAYIQKKAFLTPESIILDVGCGTGALLNEHYQISQHLHGIDLDLKRCEFAYKSNSPAFIVNGNALSLPYKNASFDFVYCQYLLLWIPEKFKALEEMRRVCKSGGFIALYAEPDYGARIDYPESFKRIGYYQNQSLKKQGVQLEIGRQLRDHLIKAGFEDIKMGMLSGEWRINTVKQFHLEWEIIGHDLSLVLPENHILDLYTQAFYDWQNNSAFSFIPTFYAIAKVP